MTKISKFVGVLLSVIGIAGYVMTDFASVTALIPMFLGLPIAVCGWLTEKQPQRRVIYMHIAVTLGVLGVIGTGKQAFGLEEFGSVKSVSLWSSFVLCFVLVGCYIQSFINARKAK